MGNYQRPIVIDSDFAEGVYAASGGVNHAIVTINNATTVATQWENAYYNTLSWRFNGGDHSEGGMKLILTYDRPVTYLDTGTPFVSVESGNGTNVLYIDVALGTKYASCQGCSITVTCDTPPTLQTATATCYGDK